MAARGSFHLRNPLAAVLSSFTAVLLLEVLQLQRGRGGRGGAGVLKTYAYLLDARDRFPVQYYCLLLSSAQAR